MKKIIRGILFAIAMVLFVLMVSSMLEKPKAEDLTTEDPPENFEEVPEPTTSGVDYLYDVLLYYENVAPGYLEKKNRYDELQKKRNLTQSDKANINVLKNFLDENQSISIPSRDNIFQYVDAIHVEFCNQITDSVLIIDFIGELGRISPGVNGSDEILTASKNLVSIANKHETLRPFIRHAVLLNDLLIFRFKYYKGV